MKKIKNIIISLQEIGDVTLMGWGRGRHGVVGGPIKLGHDPLTYTQSPTLHISSHFRTDSSIIIFKIFHYIHFRILLIHIRKNLYSELKLETIWRYFSIIGIPQSSCSAFHANTELIHECLYVFSIFTLLCFMRGYYAYRSFGSWF